MFIYGLGAGKEVCSVHKGEKYIKVHRLCALSVCLKVLPLNGFLWLLFLTALTNTMLTHYIQNVCKRATLRKGLRRDTLFPHLAPRVPDIFLGLFTAPVSVLAGGGNYIFLI